MMEALKLHDIKDIVAIPDNSIYYFSATVIVSIGLAVLVGWLLFRFLKARKKINWQSFYLNKLRLVDLNDSKKAAYEITEYGKKLTKDETQRKFYDDLVEFLETYKYKKSVNALDAAALEAIKTFTESFEK